jgi:tetraacyldisaccharide 4'-kinase
MTDFILRKMYIKTPEFWTKKNLLSISLLPLSFVYFLSFSLIKFFTEKKKISKPVICVGNLIAGGSGKTPTAIALGKILHEMNVEFAFLSRGYMGDGSKFLLLKKDHENKAEQVGDEPLLLLETAPTFVAKNRFFAAKEIERINKFSAIVLDDGMQSNSLYHDFTVLVIDGKIGFGNEFLIPAGPMRQTVKSGLKEADLVVIVGEAKKKLLEKLSHKKITQAQIIPTNLSEFSGKKLLAFCGLAYPQKFFSFLENQGLEVVKIESFPDHHFYKNNELKKLSEIAEEKNLTLITTKKDWIKFPQNFKQTIAYLDIELIFEDKNLVITELRKIL